MAINEDEKRNIIQAIESRGANLPCSRCGNQDFTLIDGFFNQSLQDVISGALIIGGVSVPSVGIVCNRCGFIAQHSLGVLGLMPKSGESSDLKDQTENENEKAK